MHLYAYNYWSPVSLKVVILMRKTCRPSPKVKRAGKLLAKPSTSKRWKSWAGRILAEHKKRVH